MESRRKFLKASAAALTVAATKPLFGIQGSLQQAELLVQRFAPLERLFLAQTSRLIRVDLGKSDLVAGT